MGNPAEVERSAPVEAHAGHSRVRRPGAGSPARLAGSLSQMHFPDLSPTLVKIHFEPEL